MLSKNLVSVGLLLVLFYMNSAISENLSDLPIIQDIKNTSNLFINKINNKNGNRYALCFFVSFSMPDSLIKTYLRDAALLDGIVVIRGIDKEMTLREFALKRLLPLLQYKGTHAKLDINPLLFNQYNVTAVPTIVFLDIPLNEYWKISGAVSTQWALETLREAGASTQLLIAKMAKTDSKKNSASNDMQPDEILKNNGLASTKNGAVAPIEILPKLLESNLDY